MIDISCSTILKLLQPTPFKVESTMKQQSALFLFQLRDVWNRNHRNVSGILNLENWKKYIMSPPKKKNLNAVNQLLTHSVSLCRRNDTNIH